MSKARQIAVGGILSALSLVLMYLSMFLPLSHVWVTLSGFAVMLIVIEAGRRTACGAYAVVSLLCFALIPNILITLSFALFFGYYPIIKTRLDGIGRAWPRRAVKAALFSVCAAVSLFIRIRVLGIAVIFGQGRQFWVYIALPFGQMLIWYIWYDYFLRYFHWYYVAKLRPRVFGRG